MSHPFLDPTLDHTYPEEPPGSPLWATYGRPNSEIVRTEHAPTGADSEPTVGREEKGAVQEPSESRDIANAPTRVGMPPSVELSTADGGSSAHGGEHV